MQTKGVDTLETCGQQRHVRGLYVHTTRCDGNLFTCVLHMNVLNVSQLRHEQSGTPKGLELKTLGLCLRPFLQSGWVLV